MKVIAKLSQHVVCISFSLWMTIACEASSVSRLSDMDWLRSSISEADAGKFCTDILKICDGPFNNFTSIESKSSACGIVECCLSLPSQRWSRQRLYDKLSATKEHQIRNMCFAKWAYREMLEGNDELRYEAMQKLDRLMLLEKESSQIYRRTVTRLARDLKNIANGIVGSRSLFRRLPHQTSGGDYVLKRSSVEKDHHVTSRSANNARCRMIMSTVLVTYAPHCAPKSIIIWYCQGTCQSRSVPQYYEAISNTRSVESCTCCSARSLRVRTLSFRCAGGNILRQMAWPFDCSCRPCSSVPSIEEAQTS